MTSATNEKDKSRIVVEDDRTGTSIETLRRAMADHLHYTLGRFPKVSTKHDYFMAVAYAVRDRLLNRWINTGETYVKEGSRMVCYLSAEFLMGPQLANNLISLNLLDQFERAVSESGLNLDEMIEQEEEPGLGNGGLGRLAACYLDSLATLSIPAIGYGIRYEFGIFDQVIRDGWQVEITDKWLRLGNPWEICRPESAVHVKLGGHTEQHVGADGKFWVKWVPEKILNAVPYDTPVPGYKTNTANNLRLWKAEAKESFDLQAFNAGDFLGAVNDKVFSENVSKVLYPNDDTFQGKQLRLEQQYFFVSASLQDAIKNLFRSGAKITQFHERFAFQLNDTHPSVAIAELMRLLIDEYEVEWDQAWDITIKTFGYTNHTLMPEALERWSVPLFQSVLPRHYEIILEINSRFLKEVQEKFPGDDGLISRVSLIDEHGPRYVRMAHLACVGSHAINGVAQLHSELLKQDVLRDFYKISPKKFGNVTNGVTPRRFMLLSNPDLSALITEKIGDGWLTNLSELKKLEAFANDKQFLTKWRQVKLKEKEKLATYVKHATGIEIDPKSMFDMQVKRIHEYKRQHLNALHIVTLYNRIKKNPSIKVTPRTFLFAGKAAPGYVTAKLMIKLITSIGKVVNNDPDVAGRIKVVFIPDFTVRLGQKIYPACDLSEQISTAGKEASGTGNMKFALNGALTIGTLDGANVEMLEEVGKENFFLFGLTAQQVADLKAEGYHPRDYYHNNEELREALDAISRGVFSENNQSLFSMMVENLLDRDDYMLLADYQAYIDCQEEVSKAYLNEEVWATKSVLNVARMGKFSSDRSIADYLKDIWKVAPVNVKLDDYTQQKAVLVHK